MASIPESPEYAAALIIMGDDRALQRMAHEGGDPSWHLLDAAYAALHASEPRTNRARWRVPVANLSPPLCAAVIERMAIRWDRLDPAVQSHLLHAVARDAHAARRALVTLVMRCSPQSSPHARNSARTTDQIRALAPSIVRHPGVCADVIERCAAHWDALDCARRFRRARRSAPLPHGVRSPQC